MASTMTLLEQVKSNDPDLKELRLTEHVKAYGGFEALIDALQHNSVIEYVRCDRDFLPSLSMPERCDFLEQVGSLPLLEECHFLAGPLPVYGIRELVDRARDRLQVLELCRVPLQGTVQDWQEFEIAMYKHPSLQQFIMVGFTFEDHIMALDTLIKSISTIPHLSVVKLDAAKDAGLVVSGVALAPFFRVKTLTELTLCGIPLSVMHVSVLAAAVSRSDPPLQVLALSRADMDDAAVAKLAPALALNTSLQNLDLCSNQLCDDGFKALAEALHVNKSLRTVRLYGNKNVGQVGLEAIAAMMLNNTTLQRLDVEYTDASEARGRIETQLRSNRGQGTGGGRAMAA